MLSVRLFSHASVFPYMLWVLLTACTSDSDQSNVDIGSDRNEDARIEDPVVDARNEGVRIEGMVFDASNGEPVRDAIVRTDPPSESVSTSADGTFTITDSVNGTGTYRVIASHQAYDSAQTTISASTNSTSMVNLPLQSNVLGLHADTTLVQFSPGKNQQTLLLTSNLANTGYSIAVTDAWVMVDHDTGEIRNRETVPIFITIDRSALPDNQVVSSQLVINSTNGTRTLIISLSVLASDSDGTTELNSRQLDCRQPDILRFGLGLPSAPLIQFPESLQLPENASTRQIEVPNPFLVDSFVLTELGIVTIEHVAGGPENTSVELFELDTNSVVNTITFNNGVSSDNLRGKVQWALVPGVYCYYLGGTNENFTPPVQLQVRLDFTQDPQALQLK